MKKVICIGSALGDVFLPTSDGIVTDTPDDILAKRKITFELGAKYRIENRYTALGGCALNVSIGLARLGAPSAPYSLIGGDGIGMWIRDTLMKNKVDTSLLRQVSEAQTDLSVILVNRRSGERVIFVNRDLQETLIVDASAMGKDSMIFVSALSGRWRENYEIVQRSIDECGCALAYNPGQSNLDEDMGAVKEMIARSSYFFVNKDEAMQIVASCDGYDTHRLDDVQYLFAQLRALGAKTIIITAGLDGAWLMRENALYFAPSSGEKPLDTTGAGDAFTSGVLAAFVREESPETACAWGAVNAANVIRFYGSNTGLLSLQEMRKRADVFVAKVERIGVK